MVQPAGVSLHDVSGVPTGFRLRLLILIAIVLIGSRSLRADGPAELAGLDALYPSLDALYIDLHKNPELSLHEEKTAAKLAARLRALGFEVSEHVGGHGIVGVLKNGQGPAVLVRTDMDALPIKEQTGLAYASSVSTRNAAGEAVPVMHACGHDIHMTSWVGAATLLARAKDRWHGTLVFVGQPAEELLQGAELMIKDGLLTRFPKPDFVLGVHDTQVLPSDQIGVVAGPASAASNAVDITFYGKGGHGASPHRTIDPLLIAARTVVTLQTIVSREVNPFDPAVVTVGTFHAGSKRNVISDDAKLELTVRSYKPEVQKQLLAAIERIAKAEAAAARAPREPAVVVDAREASEVVFNDPALAARLTTALRRDSGMRTWWPPSPRPPPRTSASSVASPECRQSSSAWAPSSRASSRRRRPQGSSYRALIARCSRPTASARSARGSRPTRFRSWSCSVVQPERREPQSVRPPHRRTLFFHGLLSRTEPGCETCTRVWPPWELMNRRSLLAGGAGIFASSCAGHLLRRTTGASSFATDFDLLHSRLAADYCFFDQKQTDWPAVGNLFRPRVAEARDAKAFMMVVEEVLDTLYDPHTHLGSNRGDSWRLPPFDIWAEWEGSRAVVTEVRRGSRAENAGVRAGQEAASINGIPIRAAVQTRTPKVLRKPDPLAQRWALLSVLAGRHDDQRVLGTRGPGDDRAVERQLDGGRAAAGHDERFEVRWLRPGLAYMHFANFSDSELVGLFDRALEDFRSARAIVMDVRDNSGGDTAIARPILGRLVAKRTQYAWMAKRQGPGFGARWPEFIDPRGPWTFTGKVVVAANHWSESMAEGFAMALSGIGRARVVGTAMAGLGAGLRRFHLPASGLDVQYSAEPIYQLSGRSRSDFVPDVVIRLEEASEGGMDPVLAAAIAEADM